MTASTRPKTAVLVQRFLPHYREQTLDSLARGLKGRGWDFVMLYGKSLGRPLTAPWAKRIAAWAFPLRLNEISETAVMLPTLIFHLMRRGPDVAVLEDVSGFPNSLVGAAYCRSVGRPYLIWGLGRIPGKTASLLRRWLNPVIDRFYRGAAGFVCYSVHAMDVYRPYGKPVYLAPNACLPAHDVEQKREMESRIAARDYGAGLRIVTVGTLIAQKRVDVLIRAAAQLSMGAFTLHIVGDGPARPGLEKLAADLKCADRVVFHGAIYGREEKFNLLSSCHLGALPGRGGLAIQELLWHGLPVISGLADGTERDLIRDGENGRLFDGFMSPEDLARAVEEFAAHSDAKKRKMSAEALETIARVSNTELMAAGVLKAVLDQTAADR